MEKKKLLKPYVPIKPNHHTENNNCDKIKQKICEIEPLEIFPNEVSFKDIQQNQTYQINVLIRNLTKQARKIRIFVPISENFDIKYDQKITLLASGLALKLTVIFDSKNTQEDFFESNLRIVSQNFEKILPIKAFRTKDSINFPEFVNLGYMKIGKVNTAYLEFENGSKNTINFSIDCKQIPNLKIIPQKIELKQYQKLVAKLEYTPYQIGMLKNKIFINPLNNLKLIKNQIQIRGITVQNSCFVYNQAGKSVQKITFNHLYLGQKCASKYFIVNNSPKTLKFKIIIVNGYIKDQRNQYINIMSPQNLAKEHQQRIINCFPQQGCLQPYTQIPIEVIAMQFPTRQQIKIVQKRLFNRKKDEQESLQNNQIYTKSTILIQWELQKQLDQQIINIPVDCFILMPKLWISEQIFDFGENNHIKEESIIPFEIENLESKDVSIKFQQNSNKIFYVNKVGKISAKSSRFMEMVFNPKIPGTFNYNIKLQILGAFEFDLKVFGICRSKVQIANSFMSNSITDLRSSKNLKLDKIKVNDQKQNMSTYIKEKRKQREQKKLDSILKVKLRQKIQKNFEEIPIDKPFQAGVISKPIEQKIILPIYPQKLYLDENFKQKQQAIINVPSKSWPSEPKNHRQARDIQDQLKIEQLKNIITNTNHIDFGTVFIKSISKKFFTIRNNTNKFREIQLYTNSPELSGSKLKKQIIPPNQTAGFEIVLESKTPGAFKTGIKYKINVSHEFQFLVTANLIIITLEPSVKHIKTQFNDNNLSFKTIQTFKLYNNGNANTKFKFVSPTPDKCFSVQPLEGQVEAQSSTQIKLFYNPKCLNNEISSQRTQQEKVFFKVIGGNQSYIKCIGVVNEARCIIKQSEINLGEVAVGSIVDTKFTIKNLSRFTTVFAVEFQPQSLNNHLEITQTAYKLAPQEKREVTLKFISRCQKLIKGDIICTVRAAKKFRIAFNAKSIIPKIFIKESQINFGKIITTTGNSSCQKFTLKNESVIDGILSISRYIEYLDEHIEVFLQNQFQQYIWTQHVPKFKQGSKENSLISENTDNDETQNNKSVDDKSTNYILKVPAGSQINVSIKVFPKKIGIFQYYLPIKLKDYDDMIEGLSRKIYYEATEPSIIIQPQNLDFKKKIITQKQEFKTIKIEITNPSEAPVSWKIIPIKKDQPFIIDPCQGIICQKTKGLISVHFNPLYQGVYESKYQLFVNSMKDPYLELMFNGIGIFPSLVFDRKELIFPVVPLNIESRITFKIQNDGYQNITLNKWKISEYFQNVDIKLEFKQGRNLGITKRKLVVQATFKSSVPISLTSSLYFYDDNNNKFSLPISATAQNCILTNHSYLEINQGEYIINYDDKQQITIVEQVSSQYDLKSYKKVTTIASYKKQMPISSIKLPSFQITKKTSLYILRWLKYFVNDKISAFPKNVSENNGQPIFMMLSILTNKTYKPAQLSSDKQKKIKELLNIYNELIRNMKIEGAFLNHIRPEYLLSESDFVSYTQQNKLSTNYNNFSAYFECVSTQCWSVVFYQICKIFILQKITPKLMKQILSNLGIQFMEKDKSFYASNLYCYEQYLILDFVNCLYREKNKRIVRFDDNVFNGQFFALLIDKILGTELYDKLKPIRKETRIQDMNYNSSIIVDAFNQYGLSFHLVQNDLTLLSPKEIVLFLTHFITILPFYFPKQTLKFTCSLREETFKLIQLFNPSNKQISYWAKQIGGQGFKINTDKQIIIAPKQTVQFPVNFICKFSKNVQGKIIFIQKVDDDNKNKTAPLIFLLKSDVIGKNVTKSIRIETPQYECTTLSIDIENPFDVCQYPLQLTITMNQQFQNKKIDKKPIPSFFLNQTRIKLFKLKQNKLEVKFFPMILSNVTCKITFFEPNQGQFIYELIGIVMNPLTLKKIKLKDLIIYKQEILNIEIPTINQQLLKIKKLYLENFKSKLKNNLVANKFFCEIVPNDQFIKVPNQFTISTNQKVDEEGFSNQTILFPLEVSFKKIYKQYNFYLILKNSSQTDIRIFRLTTKIQPQPIKIKLNIQTPAKTELLQNFPVRSFPSKVTLITESNHIKLAPQSPKEFLISNQNNNKVILLFKPSWICKQKATLMIEDQQTMEQTIYQINGIGLNPLPQQNIVINMKNHSKNTKYLQCKNGILGTLNLTPELTMDYCKFVNKTPVSINRLGSSNLLKSLLFQLEFNPTKTGTHKGQLKLVDKKTNQYIWYAITLEVTDSESKGQIKLCCKAGEEKIFTIQPFTTSDIGNIYLVSFEGPCISGESSFTVNSITQTYKIKFKPNRQLQEKGKIIFTDTISQNQYWYLVDIKSEPRPIMNLPTISCQIGKSKQFQINLNNSNNYQVTYKIKNSNPSNFQINQNQISLLPNQSKVLKVIYKPIAFKQIEKSELQLLSTQTFQLLYGLSGKSISPDTINQELFETNLFQICENIIRFKNPLPTQEMFKFQFQKNAECFSLIKKDGINKQNQKIIKSQHSEDFLIRFQPTSLKLYEVLFYIEINENLRWVYKLIGNVSKIIKVVSSNIIKSPCRQTINQIITVNSQELKDIESIVIPKQFAKILSSTITSARQGELKIQFTFAPLKPFHKKQIQIILINKKNGKLKFPLILEATFPEIDDKFAVESLLGESKEVCFRLTNKTKLPSTFKAYITEQSDIQFDIEPKKGQLEGYGKSGTLFTVKFKAEQYKKAYKGKLIIQTQQMYWSFNIIGRITTYNKKHK